MSKFQAFAADKLNVTENIEVVFHMIENTAVKGESAVFKRLLGATKVVIVWQWVKN